MCRSGFAFLVIVCSLVTAADSAEINFGAASYTHQFLLNGGAPITNPLRVDVESENAGAFALEVLDASGAVKASNTAKNEHGGWTGWDLPSLGIPNGSFKLRFTNKASGTRMIHGGVYRTRD